MVTQVFQKLGKNLITFLGAVSQKPVPADDKQGQRESLDLIFQEGQVFYLGGGDGSVYFCLGLVFLK